MHFWQIQASFLLLKQWGAILHHPRKLINFFNLCLSSQSLFFFCFGAFFFEVGINFFNLKKNPNSISLVNWRFNFWLFAPPFDSPPFHTLGKAENAFLLATTLWRCTKPTMLILELDKNGKVGVLSTISSIHSLSSILTKFEQHGFKKTMKFF